MRYSLIIPVYNEEETIQELYKRCSAVLDKLKGTYEIIFVNDGSTDTTRALLLKLRSKNKRIKIINFSRNFGHQVAVNAGMRHSSGEYVAIIDGDLQDPPEILPKFFAKLEKGYDVVYGTRKKRKESFCKRFLYNLFYRSLQAIVNLEIPLDSGDFCVMKRHIVDAINLLPERNRYIRGLRSWVGGKQIGIDYKRNRRYKGKSKYTVSKLFKLAFDGIFSFSYIPLQIMFYFGLAALLLSVAGTVIAVYLRFFTTAYKEVPGFATTIILIMFIGGLQLFSIGIMGEYMRRVYDEVKQRPEYIIDSLIGFAKKN